MSTSLASAIGQTQPELGAHVSAEPRSDRWFYVGMAAAVLVAELVGFSHSESHRVAQHIELSPLAVFHVTLFTSWLLLFLAQTLLVATSNVRAHRRLGIAGAVLASVMVVTSLPLAVALARRGVGSPDPRTFLLVIVVDVVAFGAFTAAGIYFRRRRETHGRCMLLATMSLLPPGLSRWPIATHNPAPVIMVAMLLFLAMPLVRDRLNGRPMHRVSLIGGLTLLLSVLLRFPLGMSRPWQHFASWLTR